MQAEVVPETPENAASADESIHDLLVAAAARLSRLHATVLAEQETRLTFRQYRTLSRVAEGYTSMSQLAARANLSLPTVSENVDGLVRRGLMTTSRSSTDRRATVLQVTPEGQRAIAIASEALYDVVDQVTRGVPPEDLAVMTRALRQVFDAATEYFASKDDDPDHAKEETP